MTVRRTLYILSLVISLTSFGPPVLTAIIPRTNAAAISVGEAADLVTPLLVVGAILLILKQINGVRLSAELGYSDALPLGFTIVFAIVMTSGHGIHLSSNSLSHFLNVQSHGDVYQLNHLYDEVISHYMWHLGAFGLSASMALYQLKYPLGRNGVGVLSLLPPSLLYAFTFAFATIEGGTVPVILPLVLVGLLGYSVVVRRRALSLRQRPVLVFFMLCSLLMLLGWLAYAITWGDFTPPSELAATR